ncbi:DUF397 domain-containing protein [Actinomycetospora termitidis]|uniref:DUF397 domain-containing protein n=1 Tax=Actinomycetospora termitidis TaxID=3053470 RepID=A0ABT7M168_9PSEU|nr:DUF397 domain-containing protein [Actinomycetospora sp. Odt1-22]MDL5154395.1 DUF397 domain-containing protein [Actinomycetospora sp. Odt1-22]
MHTTASRLAGAAWRRSRHSGKQGNCVELAPADRAAAGHVAVRNSRFPDEPALLLTRTDLAALLSEVRAGRFDDLLEGA